MEVITSCISALSTHPQSTESSADRWPGGTGHHWVGALLAKVPWGSAPKSFPSFPKDMVSLPRPSLDRLQSFQSSTVSRLLDLGVFVTVCSKKAM